MRCEECNAELSRTDRICPECGLDLRTHVPGRRRRRRDTESSDNRGLPNRSPLADDEEAVLWTGSFSAKGLIHSWLLAVLLTIVMPVGAAMVQTSPLERTIILVLLTLVWLGLAAFLLFQRLNVHYELTNQRLIHRSGILLRRTNRIELIDMDDVSHEQGIIERLFDVGTIEITSSDRSHPQIKLPGINRVDEVAMLIDDARRRERIRRGIHIEQI